MTYRASQLGESQVRGASWWEKTVEYKFVVDVLPGLASAFPFDGDAEKSWGDVLVEADGCFRLIEFKARIGDARTEKKKYPSMCSKGRVIRGDFHRRLRELHPEVCGHRGHVAHWLVFGEDRSDKLVLRFQHYGGAEQDALLQGKDELQALHGVDFETMRSYLFELGTARDLEGSGGGGLSVLGVTKDGPILLTIQEFRALTEGDAPHPEEYDPDAERHVG